MTSFSSENFPSKEKAKRFLEAIAFSETAYELNNGYGIAVGKALRFHEDSALKDYSNERPQEISIPDGYIVTGVQKIEIVVLTHLSPSIQKANRFVLRLLAQMALEPTVQTQKKT